MSTNAEFANYRDEALLDLCAELDRLNRAKDNAMAAYIAQVHAQRGLTGEELQKAMHRTAEAQEAFEQLNALAYRKEKELAACKLALREQSLA